MLKAFLKNERGATSIEYALIACFISIVIVGAARTLGSNLSTNYYQKVANNLT